MSNDRAPAQGRLADRFTPDWIVEQLFLGVLGRSADDTGLTHYARMLEDGKPLSDVARDIATSPEARARGMGPEKKCEPLKLLDGCLRSEAVEIFKKYEDLTRSAVPGFVTDFMGNKTSVRVSSGLVTVDGRVEPFPFPGNFHGETLEWLATLRSVEEARDEFAMIELGAGWAPWCAIGYKAAKMRELKNISLLAVEGDAGHAAFAQQHVVGNNIPASAITIRHGVVGPKDGIAQFPRHRDSSKDYGGAASFSEGNEKNLEYFQNVSGDNIEVIENVDCFSIATLIGGRRIVDLIHCDIQGAELDVIPASIDTLCEKVRRVIVGTHSHEIDRSMINIFASRGWSCEGISAVVIEELENGVNVVRKDGCQVWRNTDI